MWILQWLAQRQATAMAKRFKDGYAFAAGELLREGDIAMGPLRNYVHSSRDFGCFNNFDRGVCKAMHDYAVLTGAVKP